MNNKRALYFGAFVVGMIVFQCLPESSGSDIVVKMPPPEALVVRPPSEQRPRREQTTSNNNDRNIPILVEPSPPREDREDSSNDKLKTDAVESLPPPPPPPTLPPPPPPPTLPSKGFHLTYPPGAPAPFSTMTPGTVLTLPPNPSFQCPTLLAEESPVRISMRKTWGPINPSPTCVHAIVHLEPLIPFVPLMGHPCPTGKQPYKTYVDHINHLNWAEMTERQTKSKFLYTHCPEAQQKLSSGGRKLLYIDGGARDYAGSAAWFRRVYPEGNRFYIVALEVEANFGKEFTHDKLCEFHNAAVWNETGYVTFYIDPLNMFGSTGGLFTEVKPPARPNHLTVASLSIKDILSRQNITEDDFVVLKIDVEGGEWMLLKYMADHNLYRLVDEIFVECHNVDWNPRWADHDTTTLADCHNLMDELRQHGVYVHEWY